MKFGMICLVSVCGLAACSGETEPPGQLLPKLPKDKSIAPEHVLIPTVRQVRIVVCAGGDLKAHLADKGAHEKVEKPNLECAIAVEGEKVGVVHKTESHPEKGPENREVYQAMAAKALEASKKDEGAKPPVFILDADGEVGYEHVIGVVNALRELGIENVEFVGNPRHDKYYGTPGKKPPAER